MKVNNFNFSLGSFSVAKLLTLVAVVFMMSATNASAQNYVDKDVAITRLNNAIVSLSSTQGYPNLVPNSTVTLVLYYKEIINQLSSTSNVKEALKSAHQYFIAGSAPVLTTVAPKNHPVITKNELNGIQSTAVQLLSI